MINDQLQYDIKNAFNYKCLVSFFMTEQDDDFFTLLDNYYFEQIIHEHFASSLTINGNKCSPSELTKEQREEIIISLFGEDALNRYGGDYCNDFVEQEQEDLREDIDIWDYFTLNVRDFDVNLEPVMPLEPELVPEPLREYAVQSASCMDKAPLDFIVVPILTCFGALLGNSVRIKPKVHAANWLIPPNLWAVIIGAPSSKKTPSMNYGLNLLDHAIENVLNVQNKAYKQEYKTQIHLYNGKKKNYISSINNAVKEGDIVTAETLSKELALLEKPTMVSRDFVINDATQEALALKLSQNRHGVLSVRDELSGWLEAMNKPNQNHARAFTLETFNGSKNYSVERITSESFNIDLMLTSVLGGLQPSKLSPLLKDRNEGISDDGLIERVLQFAVQPDFNGSEYTDHPVAPELEERAQKLFETVANISVKNDEPLIFSYSNTGQVEWDKWAIEHAKKVRLMGDSMQAIYGKQPAMCAKLILIFHVISEISKPDVDLDNLNTSIGIESLLMGFKWITYLDSHINRILNFVAQDKKYIGARDLLDKMSKLPDDFTVKHISDKGWAAFKNPKVRDDALAILVEHNYLQLEEELSGTRTKRVYYKHLSLMI